MPNFLKVASLRTQLIALFCSAILLHLCIPFTFWFVDIPHEELWTALATLIFCAIVMTIALTLVSHAVKSINDITKLALNFGKNPDCQQTKMDENGTTEVRQAAQAFNSMRRQIQNLMHERDDMYTALAHDMRTPLSRIQINSELIADEQLRENIQSNIHEISNLLEKGMALTKSGLSAETPLLLDLPSFIESFVEEASPPSLTIECFSCVNKGERICVMARPSALELSLRNLLSNAIAYGRGRVQVRIASTDTQAFVDVIDNGPGIPDCCLDRVMRPFFRLDSSRNKCSGGLGLGLSIAQNAAKLDGGEIHLSNLHEGGMRARLALPRATHHA